MDEGSSRGSSGFRILLAFLPLVAFLGLAIIFYKQLAAGGSSNEIPSALLNKPAPETNLIALDGLKVDGQQVGGLDVANFKGKISVVNVFASWCAPCRAEHPYLIELAKDDRIQMIGINYKDQTNNALRFLGQLGNPYSAVGVDPSGRQSIEWGVYGVPETFIVGPESKIRFKHVGPINAQSLKNKILPVIEKIALGQT